MEDLLSTIQRYLASISAHELSTAANYILKGTDIIWKLADCLERTQDEQEYWESEEKSLYLDTIRNLKGANEYIQQHKATENLREIEDLF